MAAIFRGYPLSSVNVCAAELKRSRSETRTGRRRGRLLTWRAGTADHAAKHFVAREGSRTS